MGLWYGVQSTGDNNASDNNDGGEGCVDSHGLLMSIMNQTDVGAVALSLREEVTRVKLHHHEESEQICHPIFQLTTLWPWVT